MQQFRPIPVGSFIMSRVKERYISVLNRFGRQKEGRNIVVINGKKFVALLCKLAWWAGRSSSLNPPLR